MCCRQIMMSADSVMSIFPHCFSIASKVVKIHTQFPGKEKTNPTLQYGNVGYALTYYTKRSWQLKVWCKTQANDAVFQATYKTWLPISYQKWYLTIFLTILVPKGKNWIVEKQLSKGNSRQAILPNFMKAVKVKVH